MTTHQTPVSSVSRLVASGISHNATTAISNGVPIVGVYETMPTPGYDYQSWMLAETRAIEAAVTSGRSTEHL